MILPPNEKLLSPYKAILAQQTQSLPVLETEPGNSRTASEELLILLNNQMTDLNSLTQSWEKLEAISKQLSTDNSALTTLLSQSSETIKRLQSNLEIAQDRINDAEDGAIYLLDENTKLYNEAKQTLAQISLLQAEIRKLKKSNYINLSFGFVSGVASMPLIVQGISQNNTAMTYSGIGVFAGSGALWCLGRFVFGWW
jgi:predicted RNase H-like nuclease (RuvC/YqgF family)